MSYENNPLTVKCTSCGAPAEYNIIRHEYCCQHCGGTVSVKGAKKAQLHWRNARAVQFRDDPERQNEEVYSCPNCGAEVIVRKGEALSTCQYCGGKPVRKGYLEDENFPQVVIGFRITLEEARERLLAWCDENPNRRAEARIIRDNIDKLQGSYLPYQLVRGSYECTAGHNNSGRRFKLRGYTEGVAVSASRAFHNKLLDAVEPFDWSEAAPFEFGYVAGQTVRLQDVNMDYLDTVSREEMADHHLAGIQKAMANKNISVYADLEDSMIVPALLPIYGIRAGSIHIAVNGQTGKVAVECHKTYTRGLPWWLYPILWTLGSAVALTLAVWLGMGMQGWEEPMAYGGMLGFFVLIVSFVAFKDNQDTQYYDQPIFHSSTVFAGRDEDSKALFGPEPPVQEVAPVFTENINGNDRLVQIKFWSPRRILLWVAAIIGWNIAPLVLGWIFAGFNVAQMWPQGVCIWFIVSVPTSVVFMFKLGQIDIYDNPDIFLVKEDGSLERLPGGLAKDFKEKGFVGMAKSALEYLAAAWPVVLFVVILSLVIAIGGTV